MRVLLLLLLASPVFAATNSRGPNLKFVAHLDQEIPIDTGILLSTKTRDEVTGATGTLNGGAGWTSDGVFGDAVSCGGSGEYVDFRKIPEMDLGSNTSITFWMRWTQCTDTELDILGTFAPASAGGWLIYFEDTNCGTRRGKFSVYNGNSNYQFLHTITTSTPYSLRQWHHIALVRGGGNLFTLYLDGDVNPFEGAGNQPTGGYTAFSASNATIFRACATNNTGTNFTHMDVDEITVWGKALTREEVRKMFADGFDSGNSND